MTDRQAKAAMLKRREAKMDRMAGFVAGFKCRQTQLVGARPARRKRSYHTLHKRSARKVSPHSLSRLQALQDHHYHHEGPCRMNSVESKALGRKAVLSMSPPRVGDIIVGKRDDGDPTPAFYQVVYRTPDTMYLMGLSMKQNNIFDPYTLDVVNVLYQPIKGHFIEAIGHSYSVKEFVENGGLPSIWDGSWVPQIV